MFLTHDFPNQEVQLIKDLKLMKKLFLSGRWTQGTCYSPKNGGSFCMLGAADVISNLTEEEVLTRDSEAINIFQDTLCDEHVELRSSQRHKDILKALLFDMSESTNTDDASIVASINDTRSSTEVIELIDQAILHLSKTMLPTEIQLATMA